MQLFLTQLQSYNAMFKLLDNYAEVVKGEDILALLGYMSFINETSTADPAIWEEWLEAINEKKQLTKQEAFEGMIRFLEIYRDFTSSLETSMIINLLESAKDCNDIQVPLVKQWNKYLNEVLQEPEGTRIYLQPAIDPCKYEA